MNLRKSYVSIFLLCAAWYQGAALKASAMAEDSVRFIMLCWSIITTWTYLTVSCFKFQIEDPVGIHEITNVPPTTTLVSDNWPDWESWEISEDVAQAFPVYRSGYDLDGLVGK